MDFTATHVDVVIASYALTGLCLFGLIFYIVIRDRKLARKLND